MAVTEFNSFKSLFKEIAILWSLDVVVILVSPLRFKVSVGLTAVGFPLSAANNVASQWLPPKAVSAVTCIVVPFNLS